MEAERCTFFPRIFHPKRESSRRLSQIVACGLSLIVADCWRAVSRLSELDRGCVGELLPIVGEVERRTTWLLLENCRGREMCHDIQNNAHRAHGKSVTELAASFRRVRSSELVNDLKKVFASTISGESKCQVSSYWRLIFVIVICWVLTMHSHSA